MNYDPAWYGAIAEGCIRSAEAVVPHVLAAHPEITSAVDVGCGQGWWGRVLADRGVIVLGVDGHHVSNEVIPLVRVDLEKPRGLWEQNVPKADLAVCLEVAEHLSPEAGLELVGWLCQNARVILWSAAVPGQEGQGHVNCQWPSYWAARFAAHGYGLDDGLRWKVWDDARVEPWYRQNLMIATPVDTAKTYSFPASVRHPDVWMPGG